MRCTIFAYTEWRDAPYRIPAESVKQARVQIKGMLRRREIVSWEIDRPDGRVEMGRA